MIKIYSYEEAIVDARELERQKQEQVISELKQRLETFITARQELDSRCKQYSREIQVIRIIFADKIEWLLLLSRICGLSTKR